MRGPHLSFRSHSARIAQTPGQVVQLCASAPSRVAPQNERPDIQLTRSRVFQKNPSRASSRSCSSQVLRAGKNSDISGYGRQVLGEHGRADYDPGVVVDAGQHLAFPAVTQVDPVGQVQLPQRHRGLPLPALVLALVPLGLRDHQTVAFKGPVHRRARQDRTGAALGGLERDPPRAPAGGAPGAACIPAPRPPPGSRDGELRGRREMSRSRSIPPAA